jgi:hypothetical protein
MPRHTRVIRLAPLILPLIAVTAAAVFARAADADGFDDHFNVKPDNFSTTGRNDFFILEPGYQLIFEGKENDKPARLVITVLDETRNVDGVNTRIIEERETLDGKPVEVSRNFFAIDKTKKDVYYFGEEVDEYKDGKIASHGGAWQSGKDGAHYGLMMPADPRVGLKHYQELAPKVAMDRAEVISTTEKISTPDGEFENCLKTQETTPIEPDEKEFKLYAKGIGLVVDANLKLVKHGKNIEPRARRRSSRAVSRRARANPANSTRRPTPTSPSPFLLRVKRSATSAPIRSPKRSGTKRSMTPTSPRTIVRT